MTALEMFNKLILPRLAAESIKSAVPIVTAIDTSVSHLSSILIDRESDLSRLSMSRTASAQKVALPSDFAGLYSSPVFDGNIILDPLVTSRRHEYTGKTGTPEAYELKGLFLFLYPAPATSGIITAEYWSTSEPVSGMFDEIPFYGAFDQLVADISIKIAVKGIGLITDPAFNAEINMTVDKVLFPRRKALPSRRAVHFF